MSTTKRKQLVAIAMLFVLGVTMIVGPMVDVNADVLTNSVAINRSDNYKTGVNFKHNHVDTVTPPVEGEYTAFTWFSNGAERPVYSTENPVLVPQTLNPVEFPSHLNYREIRAVLAIAQSNNADTASKAAGLSSSDYLTEKKTYTAAIQLAIWKIAAQSSKEYYVEPLNINPAGVNTVADWLVGRAKVAVGQDEREDIESAIIPKPTLEVDNSRMYVDSSTSNTLTYIGPFKVKSNKSRSIAHTMSDSRAKLYTAVGGMEMSKIETNQDFFIAFDKDYSYEGFKMDFSLSDERFDVGSYGHDAQIVVTSQWTPYQVNTSLTLGDVNSYGRIRVVKYLDEANTPIKDAKFEVRDSRDELIQTLVTGADGVSFTSDIPTGKYKVKEVENGQGYNIDPKEYEVEVTQNGEVVEVISYSTTKSGKLNITVKDIDSQMPVGYSKFQIIRKHDHALVKEVTIDETGVAMGLDIPAGNYLLKEVYTSSAYELTTVVKEFTIADQGQTVDLLFEKKVSNSKVKFNIQRDGDKEPLIGLSVDIFDAGTGDWLTTVKTGADGTYQIGLPKGTYYAKLKPFLGYAIDSNKNYPFSIQGKGETQPIDIILGLSKGDFILTIRTNQGTFLENVHVDVIDSTGNPIASNYSDYNGMIIFSDLPSGQDLNYKVTAVPLGYNLDSSIKTFKLNNNGENYYSEIRVDISGTTLPPDDNNNGGNGDGNDHIGDGDKDYIGDGRDDNWYEDDWYDNDWYDRYDRDWYDRHDRDDDDLERDVNVINISDDDEIININGTDEVIDIGGGTIDSPIWSGTELGSGIGGGNYFPPNTQQPPSKQQPPSVEGGETDIPEGSIVVDSPLNTPGDSLGKGGTKLPKTNDLSAIQYMGMGLTSITGILGTVVVRKKEGDED